MINLYVAKIYHNEEKYTEALEALNFIIKNSSSKEIEMIASVRYSRILILQEKYSDPSNLIYIAIAILIVSLATVVVRFRHSKYLKIDSSKSTEL